MSQNNSIRKSDKKFIRTEKARIRSQFLDVKKQDELINNLYKKFLSMPEAKGAKIEKPNEPASAKAMAGAVKKEVKKPEPKKVEKAKTKKVAAK